MSMSQDKVDNVGVEPPPLPAVPPPEEERRKSLSFTTSWSSQPPARKYSLNDAPGDYKASPEPPDPLVDSDQKEIQARPQEVLSSGRQDNEAESKQEIVFVHKDPKPVQKNVEKTKKVNETPASTSSMPPTPNTAMKMSCMEEEAIRDRLRTLLLRQTAEILEAEGVGTKFTKDTFRRTFLNKGTRPHLLDPPYINFGLEKFRNPGHFENNIVDFTTPPVNIWSSWGDISAAAISTDLRSRVKVVGSTNTGGNLFGINPSWHFYRLPRNDSFTGLHARCSVSSTNLQDGPPVEKPGETTYSAYQSSVYNTSQLFNPSEVKYSSGLKFFIDDV
ncbi:hypothetical protein J6590_013914 [Homalodisca vitripennis]|nr:hypothetical protein J6590_013914 [Homalodisca vitripennis]